MKKYFILISMFLLIPFIVNAEEIDFSIDRTYKYIPGGDTLSIGYKYNGDGQVKCSSSKEEYVTCTIDEVNKVVLITAKKEVEDDIQVKVYATKGATSLATSTKTITIFPYIKLNNVIKIEPEKVCTISRDTNTLAMQGVYFFKYGNNTYAIYAGYKSDTDNTILTLVDLTNCKVLARNSEKVLGHANDITYNSKENKYYVVDGKKAYSFTIDINNKKIVYDSNNPLEMPRSLSGLEYVSDGNYYISRSGNVFYKFNTISSSDKLNKINTYINYYNKTLFVSQGISYYNGNIYAPRAISDQEAVNISDNTIREYNSNYTLIYDAITGNYKYALYISNKSFWGHLEGIGVVDDYLYFGYNVHKKPTNQTFLRVKLSDISLQGDVNGDSKIDVKDYLLVRKHLLNISKLTGIVLNKADVNQDGKVSVLDYIAIRSLILNK